MSTKYIKKEITFCTMAVAKSLSRVIPESLPLRLMLLLCLTVSGNAASAQVVKTADSLFDEGFTREAITIYKSEYRADTLNYSSLYNLACALAVAGEADSSLYYLYRLMELNPTDYSLADPDFTGLRNDKRWFVYQDDLIATIQTRYNNAIADEAYARRLWEMGARDQMYYRDIHIIERRRGPSDTELHRLWQLKEQINLENQRQLEQLIRKKGWPKATMVGSRAASAAFLVIQHADLKMQQKYLPVIKSVCEEREAEWQAYALMYDRVQTALKKPQRYGSQVHYNDETHRYELFPLEDETKVDYWRKQAGMSTLAEYLSHWNIQWPEKK